MWSGQTPIVVPVMKLGGGWGNGSEFGVLPVAASTTAADSRGLSVDLGEGLAPGDTLFLPLLLDDTADADMGLLRVRSITLLTPTPLILLLLLLLLL